MAPDRTAISSRSHRGRTDQSFSIDPSFLVGVEVPSLRPHRR
jgi:hypothetical protein